MKKLLISLFIILGVVNSSFAVEIPDVMRNTMSQDVVGLPSLLHLVISMVLVITLIYITGWIYTKLNIVNRQNLKKINKDDDSNRFTVIQSMPLGQQRYLYALEIKNKILLVGATQSQITLLKEFEKSSESDSEQQVVNVDALDNVSDSKNKSSIDIDELYKKYKN